MTSAVNTERSHPKRWLFFQLLALFLLAACTAGEESAREYARVVGSTMGTSYSLVFDNAPGLDLTTLQEQLDARLEAVNDAMESLNAAPRTIPEGARVDRSI